MPSIREAHGLVRLQGVVHGMQSIRNAKITIRSCSIPSNEIDADSTGRSPTLVVKRLATRTSEEGWAYPPLPPIRPWWLKFWNNVEPYPNPD